MSKLRARRPVSQRAADSFIDAAVEEAEPEPATEPTVDSKRQATPKPVKAKSPDRTSEPLPWEGLPDNANRPFQLRLPAPLYAKLQWASEKAGKSMHRIALEAVRQAVDREARKHLG